MKNAVLVFLGFLALLIGGIGALLPIMPTTPFVLIAAACFAGGSPKLHEKLKNTKYFGEFVQNYECKTGVTKKVKTKAIIFLWITLCLSALIFQKPVLIVALSVVGIAVTLHILLIKTKNPWA